MRVILKYARRPKPRGGWRFPLWLRIGCEWEDGELDQLAPSWSYDEIGTALGDVKFFRNPKGPSNSWLVQAADLSIRSLLKSSEYQVAEDTWYFETYSMREKAVQGLHQEVQTLRRIIADWLVANDASPGDEMMTEVTYNITVTSETQDAPSVIGVRRYEL